MIRRGPVEDQKSCAGRLQPDYVSKDEKRFGVPYNAHTQPHAPRMVGKNKDSGRQALFYLRVAKLHSD